MKYNYITLNYFAVHLRLFKLELFYNLTVLLILYYSNAEFTLHDLKPDFHSPTGFKKSTEKCLKSEASQCLFMRVTITHCELSKKRSERIANAR